MPVLAAGLPSSPYIAQYDADGNRLADPATLPTSSAGGVAFSPDGQWLAVAHTGSPYITVYRRSDGAKIANPATLPTSDGNCCAFSPDSAWLAVGHYASPRLTLYYTANWSKRANPLSLPASGVSGMAFSPDGSLLALAIQASPWVTIYRTDTWTKLANPATLPTGLASSVAWSPEGALLAVGHNSSPYVTIYETAGWTKIANPGTLPTQPPKVAFSPDGALLALAGTPWLLLYQTSDWSTITGPTPPPSTTPGDLAFSADGAILAVAIFIGGGGIARFNTSDWSALSALSDPPSSAWDVTFSEPVALAGAASDYVWVEGDVGLGTEIAGDAQAQASASGDLDAAGRLEAASAAQAAATGALHGGARPSGGWLWRPLVTVGGADISAALTGTVEVEAVEGEARIADVTLLPAAGSIEPATWVGMSVAIDYGRWTGSEWAYARLFTGLVDVPEYDAVTGLLRLRCTDDLQGRMLALARAQIDALTPGTRWSAAVFDAAADAWRYAQDRMATLPAALDIDPSGTIRLTPWTPSPLPALAYDEGGILDGSLSLRLASRGEVKNRITVSFAYRYLRYKRRVVMAGFAGISTLGTYLAEGIPVPTRAMCLQALQGTGWEIVGDNPSWTAVPSGPVEVGTGWWIVTDQNLSAMVSTTDGSRKVLPAVPIVTASQAAADQLCFGFVAALERRYTQQIEEQYTLTVEAALSIAQLGVLPGSDQASLAVDRTDASAWESWRAPQSLGLGTETPAQQAQEPLPIVPLPDTELGGENHVDYTPDAATDRSACAAALETLVAKAQTAIWASHRLHRVALSVPIAPAADLSATVRVDTARITAQGKAARLRHVLDLAAGKATTDLEIAICAVAGTGIVHPADAPAAPEPPAPETGTPVLSASAYEWVGSKTASAAWNPDEMIGFSCNVASTCTDYDAGAPVYPEQFTFKTPEIEAASRDNQVLPVAQSYAAALVEDQLVIVSE